MYIYIYVPLALLSQTPAVVKRRGEKKKEGNTVASSVSLPRQLVCVCVCARVCVCVCLCVCVGKHRETESCGGVCSRQARAGGGWEVGGCAPGGGHAYCVAFF